MIITIDPYYDVNFYNECKEALSNNGVQYKEYISTKPPYYYYFDVSNPPTFINYDVADKSYTRYLVNIVKPLKPNDAYIYMRRDAYSNLKALNHYAINEPLAAAAKTGEGIFFAAEKEEILRISKEYPRKIWFMGRYFNRKYKIFFADKLIIKNYINLENILVQGNDFSSPTELEVKLNFNIFREKDRLEKLSSTPYVLNGKYYSVGSVRPEISDKFTL